MSGPGLGVPDNRARVGATVRAALQFRVHDNAVSRDDEQAQHDARQEVDAQLQLLHEFCRAHGWIIVSESAAEGEKRTPTGRPVGRPRLTFRHDQVVELRQAGRSWRQIARAVGASIASARAEPTKPKPAGPTRASARRCPTLLEVIRGRGPREIPPVSFPPPPAGPHHPDFA